MYVTTYESYTKDNKWSIRLINCIHICINIEYHLYMMSCKDNNFTNTNTIVDTCGHTHVVYTRYYT